MKLLKILSVSTLSLLCIANATAGAGDTLEKWGDLMQVMVPAYALGMAVNEEDWAGTRQFVYSFGATEAAVYGLKYTIKSERPNKADNHSFPSGHTAAAFSGASFIHKRYGIKRAIIPYLMSGFTGYSRIVANKHHWRDVIAGAMISSALSWIIVDDYHGCTVSATPESIGVSVKF